LIEFKMPQIFQDDRGHRHAKGCEIVLRRHLLLFRRIAQEPGQAVCEILRISRLVKLNRDLFALGHLSKIRKIGTEDWHAIGAGQVSNSTATG
jgi:hypothetical protein